MENIVLIGFGGHSKSVIDTIERQNKYCIAGIIEKSKEAKKEFRDYAIIGTDEDLERIYASGITKAFVTVGFLGKSDSRNKIYNKLKEIGFSMPVIADPTAIISKDAVIGEGTFIGKGAIVNAGASVGKMCIINTGAILEHEVNLGDFCHVAVGTILCGEVYVEEDTFLGAGTTVIQGIHIGRKCVVGAGTTIVKDVAEDILAYGTTRKKLREEINSGCIYYR